jgi:hypothetical protein
MWTFDTADIKRDDLNNNYFYNLRFTRVTTSGEPPTEIQEQHFKFFCSPSVVPDEELQSIVMANLKLLNPVPSIIDNLEKSKEELKMDLFGYLKLNPQSTFEQTLQYVAGKYGWPDEALVKRMIYEYAKNAHDMGLLDYIDMTPEVMFNSIRDFIVPLTEDQLLQLVGP